MKGLNKIALVTAIAALSAGAQAELKAMDDVSMSAATGQAGITIELSAKVDIGEIAYVDQDDTTAGTATGGRVFISNVEFGGGSIAGRAESALGDHAVTNRFDNLQINIDVAGSGDNSALENNWGLGKIAAGNNGGFYSIDVHEGGADTPNVSTRELRPTINDGDLVIGLDIIKPTSGLVDFGLNIGSVSLGESSTAIGSTVGVDALTIEGSNTVLMSDLSMHGALGPVDIVIDGQNGGMNVNAWFGITHGSVKIPFMNTSLEFKLHDDRGLTHAEVTAGGGPTGESAAHVQMQITATDDAADLEGALLATYTAQGDVDAAANAAETASIFSGKEGLFIQVTDFSGDLDLTNIMVGDATTGSIGGVYLTDLSVQADMLIYGH